MWSKNIANPSFFESLYDTPPSLDNVEILKVEFDRDGPSILITFSTDRLPDHAPKKWGQFNRVTFQLRFSDIQFLMLSQFGRVGLSQIQMLDLKNAIEVVIDGVVKMNFKVKYLDIVRIVGYQHVDHDSLFTEFK